MSDNIRRRKVTKTQPFDTFQNGLHMFQTRELMPWQIDLRHITGDNGLGAKTDTCQEHLHLFHCRVLRFIHDHTGMVQGSPAHIRKRCDLYNVAFHQLANTLDTQKFI